jgi:hypothetical protein
MFADIAPLYSALAELSDEAECAKWTAENDYEAALRTDVDTRVEAAHRILLAKRVGFCVNSLMAALYEAAIREDLDPAQPPAIDETSILSGLDL